MVAKVFVARIIQELLNRIENLNLLPFRKPLSELSVKVGAEPYLHGS